MRKSTLIIRDHVINCIFRDEANYETLAPRIIICLFSAGLRVLIAQIWRLVALKQTADLVCNRK